MIRQLTEKLELSGYPSPHWKVADEKIYSKYKAIKRCREIGYQWPSFHVWDKSQTFSRPQIDFIQSVDRQCEIISDSYEKVRLFYSGGRDSHLILHHMLKNKFKIDEIAVYRRFPGVIDKVTNEFDRFNLQSILKTTLDSYDVKVEVKFYDLMPEHFNYYSNHMEHYFAYTDIEFFGHGVHPVAEVYPELLDHAWVNVLGNGQPTVDENYFFWIDTDYNLTQPDPHTLQFFSDQRNTDLSVNLAYAIHDLKKDNPATNPSYKGGLQMKESLNYPKTNTPLDTKWCHVDVNTEVHRWFLEPKEILYAANAVKSDIGKQTYSKMVQFYELLGSTYQSYFENGSIYNTWIGGVSEKHILLDV